MDAFLPSILSALLLATVLVPVAAANPSSADEGRTFVVGFYSVPSEARGGRYADEAVSHVDEALSFAVVKAKAARGFEERAKHDPNVRYLQAEQYVEAQATANDPYYAQQYGLARMNVPAAWDVTRGASSVIVAVVDTGVERAHADFAGGRMLAGYDFMNNDADPNDDCGHGTGVAGVVGANANNGLGVAGVAQVSIMPLKALGMNPDGRCYGPLSAVASSIRYAADNGARVISMSLGAVGVYDQATADAIEYAYARGVVLVASAGNNGPCTNCISWPAAHPKVIAVAATDSSNAQAYFSSSGPELDVAAPGKSIYTTYRNSAYGIMSGTSLAAPQVSGVLALAISANGGLTNAELVSRLYASAKDLGAAGYDTSYGHGLVDAAALLSAGGAAPPPPPPPPANTAPIASFAATGNGLVAAVDASASSDAEGPIASYQWSWGDGLSSAGGGSATASHAYATGGTYTITLVATDAAGATASTTRTLTLAAPNAAPTATFSFNTSGLTASLDGRASSDPDGNIASWSWSYGDGTTGMGSTATHAYATGGTYTITLTVTDSAGASASTTRTLTVVAPNAAPTASFSFTASDLAVSFDGRASSDPDGNVASWGWSFGDGTTGVGSTATHAYASAGTYAVVLTVTDNAGASASVSSSVTVTAPPPPPPSPPSGPRDHVGAIDATVKIAGSRERLTWSVAIVDVNGAPVAGATVKATLTKPNGASSLLATTSSTGIATFRFDAPRVSGQTYQLCVSDVLLSGWTYDAGANVATCRSLVTV